MKKTKEQFISEAKQIFPNYDYSKVNYITSKIKVELICPKHGNFFITPHDLLQKHGCYKCGLEKIRKRLSLTTEQFLEKAKQVFPEYDYSKVNYINDKTKIKVICNKHGEFEITPNNLLSKHGCALCAKEKINPNKKTNIQFIEEAKSIFPNYDYTKTNYNGNNIKVEIICKQHGSFFIRPYDLLSGHGCAACVGLKKKTKEQFIEEAKQIFPEYYYNKVNYINAITKTEIVCNKHGSFFITPHDLLQGHGCRKCAMERSSKLRSKEEEFFEKAKIIHNNFYTYGKYINSKTKIEIYCPKHGKFLQTPESHLSGQGCPVCGLEKRAENRIKNTGVKTLSKLKELYPNYNFDNSIYEKATKNIKFICPIHGEQEMAPNDMLNGHGCKQCGIEARNIDRKLNIEEIKQRSIEYHGDVWDFSNSKYVNIYTRMEVKCKICGKINYKKPYRIIYGRCDYCLESSGERAVRMFLEEHNIKYISEYIFKDCRNINPLPFDFYLPELNTVIEYQGEQHYIQNKFFENLESRKKKDQIKREYCLKNGIKEIEIKYNENVDNILKKLI